MKYRVIASRTNYEEAYIEATSAKEAEQLADEQYSNFSWRDIGELGWEIEDVEDVSDEQ